MANLKIVAAALRLPNGLVVSKPAPARHHDLLHPLWDLLADELKHLTHLCEQGFLTSAGQFLDRESACTVAQAADQIIEKTGPDDILFSEDVW